MNERNREWERVVLALQEDSLDAAAWKALRALIAAYVPAVLGERLPSNDTDDIVQYVLMNLLDVSGTLSNEKGRIAGYVKQIVRSAAIDHMRKANARATLERLLAEKLEHAPPPAARLAEVRWLWEVEGQLDRLSEEERVLLRMRFWEGRPLGEIALALNKSYAATGTQLFRLLGKLRERLQGPRGSEID